MIVFKGLVPVFIIEGGLDVISGFIDIKAKTRDYVTVFRLAVIRSLSRVFLPLLLGEGFGKFPILVGKVEHTCDGIDTPQQYAEFVARQKAKSVK